MEIHTIPLDEIDAEALPRDRSTLDGPALVELTASIAAQGLRLPLEVAETADGFALIAGYRRLMALRRLDHKTAPAVVLAPETLAGAMALMIEENTLRDGITPWDQGRIAVAARNHGHFDTLDAAVAGLYRHVTRQKRSRLRAQAGVVAEFEGLLATPQDLSQRQLLRLAAALRGGFAELMRHTLDDLGRDATLAKQWQALDAIATEAELEAQGRLPSDPREGYPRRRIRPRRQLTIRREWSPRGWSLHFTGAEATGGLMEDIMDQIERDYGA